MGVKGFNEQQVVAFETHRFECGHHVVVALQQLAPMLERQLPFPHLKGVVAAQVELM